MADIREVVDPQASLRNAPSPDAPLDTEALCGERVSVLEVNDEGWTKGQLESDGYVGWLPSGALAAPGPAPTHKISALRTLVFPGPNIKLPPIGSIPFGAHVAISRIESPFALTATGNYLPAQHLAAIDVVESDLVAVAERFLETPYLWGGKTNLGLDCSGLVQVALNACGIRSPRDSYQQEAAVGQSIGTDVSKLRRGDLIFWKGHVAMARDERTIIHANAFHMAVAVEPIAEAIERIRKSGSDVRTIRRL